MSDDSLEQAIFALKSGDSGRARRLLTELLQTEGHNDRAWVWLAKAVTTPEWRRACLDRALALNPANQEAQLALLEWLAADHAPDTNGPTAEVATPAPPAESGLSLKEFLHDLKKNYNTLKEREAKYATAAPLDLLNQIDDYEQALALTEQAQELELPLAELEAEFSGLNLQISGVVFVDKEPTRQPYSGVNPYRGLRKFTESEATFFFGRTAAIDSLLGTMTRLVEKKTSRRAPDLIAVLGPSGSGKSSLVRAGLIPALRRGRQPGSQSWPIKVMLPGERPLDALAEMFLGLAQRDLGAIRRSLAEGSQALHQLIVESLAAAGQPDETIFVLVIDQFEELFTLCESQAERRLFIEQVLYATQVSRNRSFVVLTMRSDFYSRVAASKALAEAITQHQMLISPLTEKELREAILLPAEAVGLELEKALVETLLQDTADSPAVLPLLQEALTELFHRREGNLLTLAAYQQIGGVKGALAHKADSIVDGLPTEQRHIVRRIFLRLVNLGQGSADTRRRATFSEVVPHGSDPAEVEAIVQLLADANLIVTGRHPDTDEIIIDVGHEALIRNWPRFQAWLDKDRQGLRIRQQLSRAALEWAERERAEDSLFRGARLLETEEWAEANPAEINDLEAAFLATGIEARDRAAAEQEAQRQRELEQAQALATLEAQASTDLRRRNTILLGVGIVALLLAITTTYFLSQALAERTRTQQALTVALAGKLASQSRANLQKEVDLSFLLGLAAYNLLEMNQISDTFEARSSILAGAASHRYMLYFLHGHDKPVTSVAVSPDGQTFASASDDSTIFLWSLTTGQPLDQPLTGHTSPVDSIAFGPNGQTLVSGGADGEILLWQVATATLLRRFETTGEGVAGVAFSPDGASVASAHFDGTVLLWDVATGQPRFSPPPARDEAAWSVAFSPDGQTLASSDLAGRIMLWDVADGTVRRELIFEAADEEPTGVTSLAFSPDGGRLAAGQDDHRIVLWDLATGQPVDQPLVGHLDPVNSVAFSPDGQMLASGGEDNSIILWDVLTGQPLEAPLKVYNDGVLSLAFNPDSANPDLLMVSGSRDGAVIVWNLSTPSPLGRVLHQQSERIEAVAYSPDGQTFATGGSGNEIILWEAAGHQPQGEPLTGHEDAVTALVYSPDSKMLASASLDGTIRRWDVVTGQPLGEPLVGHDDYVWSVVFSPDGTLLASAGGDGTVRLWQATSGRPVGQPLGGAGDWLGSVVFSPDGQTVAAAGGDEVIYRWVVADGRPLAEPLAGHNHAINDLAFSPDGPLLASASEDKTIILWDAVSGHPFLDKPLSGHVGSVYDLEFQPAAAEGGLLLASASLDRTIKLWDVASGQAYGEPLSGHSDWVLRLAFSPDGQELISVGRDGQVILWDMHLAAWRALACRRANRNLTQAEWDRYVGPEIDYQPTCPNLPWGE